MTATEAPSRSATTTLRWRRVASSVGGQEATTAAVFTIMIVMTWLVNTSGLAILTDGMVFLILCYSWNIVGGFLGELSLSQMIPWAVGSYGTVVMVNAGLPVLAAAAISIVLAAFANVVLAVLIRLTRVQGLLLLGILTLVFADIAVTLVTNFKSLGGESGISLQALPPIDPVGLYLKATALAIVMAIVTIVLVKLGVAQRWLAIKDDPVVAAVCNIRILRERIKAYAISGAMAGAGGAFQLYYQINANPSQNLSVSYLILVVLAVFVGGAGTTLGPLVGAFVIFGLGAAVQLVNGGVNAAAYGQIGESALALLLLRFVLPRMGHLDALSTLGRGALLLARRLSGRPSSSAVSTDIRALGAKDADTTRPGIAAPPTAPAKLAIAARHQGNSPSDASQAGLIVSDVTVRFGQISAVKGVSLKVPPGEIVGIVGPNGAGKSTICNLISGLYRSSSGEIRLNGVPLGKASVRERSALGIGRSFQSPRLFSSLKMVENLTVTGRFPAAHARQVLQALPGSRDIDSRWGDDPGFFLRRLVEVARAAELGRSVLLLDEPLAGLTPDQQDIILSWARSSADSGCSVIVVEHLIPVISRFVDRIVVLSGGRVIESGKPEQALRSAAVVEAFLGTQTA